jgi:hypothetical protein
MRSSSRSLGSLEEEPTCAESSSSH